MHDTCISCFGQQVTEKTLSSAPCGHRFCFDCIVLISKLNHICPSCYEDITNNVEKSPPPPIDSEDEDEIEDNAVVATADVVLNNRCMHQNLKTRKCTDPYTKKEVYLSRSDYKMLKLAR
jgi:hypothetical protein